MRNTATFWVGVKSSTLAYTGTSGTAAVSLAFILNLNKHENQVN